MIGGVATGFGDFRRGVFYVLEHRTLWKWVLAPFLLALILLALVVGGAYVWVAPWIQGLATSLPSWLSFLAGVLKVLLLVLLLFGAYFVFVSLAVLISAPFNEMLSEAIERELGGEEGPAFSIGRLVTDFLRGLGHSLRRVVVYLMTTLVLFLVGVFVPGIGTIIAAIVGALVTAKFAAYDAYDAVWARKSWSYRQKTDYLKAAGGRGLGLGAGVALLLLVPVLNALALSFGAAGATLAFVDRAAIEP